MIAIQKLLIVSTFAFLPGMACAHATLDEDTAEGDAYFKGVVRVSHGCEGSLTHTVRVRIPLEIMQSKPMPKPGWDIKIVREPVEEPYEYYGRTITEDVRELVWSGGSLPDDYFDEFSFTSKLPKVDQETTFYIRVVQECDDGVNRWIEIPGPGETSDDLEEPAPGLKVVPGNADHG